MKIRIEVSTNKINSKSIREIEIEDDITNEEISKIAEEQVSDMITWDWYKI